MFLNFNFRKIKPVFTFLLVFFLNYLLFFSLNVWYLKDWSLSGDDLYSLTNAIPNFQTFSFMAFNQFSGQYRHLTYLLFSIYKNISPNFFAIFLLHGILFSLIPTILFFVLDKHLKKWFKFLLVSSIFFTPIFYYHTYTISSLANVLMSILTLLLIFYYRERRKLNSWKYSLLFLLLVIISFTIKETFILPLSIYVLTQLLNFKEKSRESFIFIFLPTILFISYVLRRISAYQESIPTDYYFIFSLKKAINNFSNIFSWLINYPKGWQYGAPIRYNPWQYFIGGFYFLILLSGTYFSYLKDKFATMINLFFILISVAIFVFLNITHVFYMDLPFLLILILISRALIFLINKHKKIAYLFLAMWVSINFINLFIIKPQWLEYSFVANANKAAKNYQDVLEKNSFENYDQICIMSHNRGKFGTEDGKLANHLNVKKFNIISTQDTFFPEECLIEKSLNLVNDAWSYSLY